MPRGIKDPKSQPSAERLRELVLYNPRTGVFTWKTRKEKRPIDKSFNTKYAGKTAGYVNRHKDGLFYNRLAIDDKLQRSSRLAWLYMTGEWPKLPIAHKNGDSLDDSWENLRERTYQEQTVLCRKKALTSQYVGVCRRLGPTAGCVIRWQALITDGTTQTHLGQYDTEEEAARAYDRAARKRGRTILNFPEEGA